MQAYIFYEEELCKFQYIVTSWSTTFSSFIVIALALDRKRRISEPAFKEDDRLRSYNTMLCTMALSGLVTAVFIPLAGIYKEIEPTAEKFYPEWQYAKMHTCWWKVNGDKFYDTYQMYYHITLVSTFVIGYALMAYSYGSISREIYQLTNGVNSNIKTFYV